MTDAEAARLIGWKRIAAHLGVSERSARRWEATEALPVHRQQHDARSTVFAYARELDRWLESRAPDEERGGAAGSVFGRRSVLVAALLVLAIVIGLGTIAMVPRAQADLSPDGEAVDLFERGTALYAQRGREPVARSIKLFTQAVERDENFAEAWAGLARSWAVYPTYDPAISEERAAAEAVSAANRALTLKPDLADIRTLLVSAAYRKRDWAEAERLYREALQADPRNSDLLIWFVGHFRNAGMFEEVDALTERALEVAPQSPPVLSEKAMNTLHLGDLKGAEAQLDYIWSGLGLRAPIVWFGKFAAMAKRGDGPAMKVFLDDLPFGNEEVFRRFAAAIDEDSPASRERFAAAVRADKALPPWIAYYFLQELDLTDQALTIAEEAARSGAFDNSVVLFQPNAKDARSTERFADIAEELGLVSYWRERGVPSICKEERKTPVCRRISEG
ncbi:tetratricopeptide repeat protein [Erythrobacter sp.]|uniref:tetratricopeptide repeat protein n=1 Tax=Erythrobacter sp. TaxID=1042 RepID=UPI002E9F13A1|nr:tetratricopeptide repeat protein [Erythrobacter sp.]